MYRSPTVFRSLDSKTRIALACAALVGIVTILGGGSSRADALLLVPVRMAALGGILVLLLALSPQRLHLQRAPLAFAGAAALLMALSLVPLPFSWWSALPGRALYAGLSAIPDVGAAARPLSLTPDLTLNALFSLVPPLLFLLAVPALDLRVQRWLLTGLLAAILLSGLLGLLQVGGGPDSGLRYYQYTNVDAATGFFANRNHQAVFLAIGIPLACWWATRSGKGRRLRAAVAASCILFLLTAAVTTQSRMGAVAVVLAIVLGVAAFYRKLERKSHRRIVLAGLVLGAALGAGAIATWSAGRLEVSSVSDDQRLRNLPEMTEMARAYFPVGAGFGAFPQAFTRFEGEGDLRPQYMNHAHNDLVEIVIEGGLPAILLLGAFAIWFARAAWLAWSPRATLRPGSDEARLSTIILLLPLVGSLTDYPLRTPLMASTFALGVAVLASFLAAARRERGRGAEPAQTHNGEPAPSLSG